MDIENEAANKDVRDVSLYFNVQKFMSTLKYDLPLQSPFTRSKMPIASAEKRVVDKTDVLVMRQLIVLENEAGV